MISLMHSLFVDDILLYFFIFLVLARKKKYETSTCEVNVQFWTLSA